MALEPDHEHEHLRSLFNSDSTYTSEHTGAALPGKLRRIRIRRLKYPAEFCIVMESQQSLNYKRIAAAIEYLRDHFREQPSLDEVAAAVHLSPAHFQRLFSEWAGLSPKQFLQYLSLDFARSRLRHPAKPSLFDTTLETGLSSTSRLHELFINIEAMTPAEFRDGGAGLRISYSNTETPFGPVLIASTDKGICQLIFTESDASGLSRLQQDFPRATLVAEASGIHSDAAAFFQREWKAPASLRLHLRGTAFQVKIWEALLRIPAGELRTYGDLATDVGNPSASRAVGSAVGSNPVAFLIPCHRVIRSERESGRNIRRSRLVATGSESGR